jgi:uncharacterized RDD family membrane protein YckC
MNAPHRTLDTATRVMTPEHISFEYQLAGPFRRIVAYLADIMISLVAYGSLAFIFWMLFTMVFANSGLIDELAGLLVFATLVGWFLVYWFYGAVTETYLNGQTYGKRMFSLRVMTVDGHAIDGVQATLRNFFRLLDMAPIASVELMLGGLPEEMPLFLPTCLIGLIAMMMNQRYQRLGDLVAGTMVIHEEPRELARLETFEDQRVTLLAEHVPPSFVPSAKLTRAISQYIDARKTLAPQRANEIAVHVAGPLIHRFGLMSDTNPDLFLCALYHRMFATPQAELEDESGASLEPNVEREEVQS